MNLLIAPTAQGALLGAVFPTTGIPEIPKSRLLQVDPATRQRILNAIPQLQTLPEPQLSQAIMQVLRRQQQVQAVQGGGTSLPHAAAIFQAQQQSMVHFLQNLGINTPYTPSMFENMGLEREENPFIPGTRAHANSSGLWLQPTSLQQLELQLQQQLNQQQQQQQQQAGHAQQ